MTDQSSTGSLTTTQIYERQRTQTGTEEEAKQFISVLQNHKNLEVTTNITEEEIIYLPVKSFEKIVKYMEEMMKYALGYIIFSSTRTIEEFESREFLRRVLKKRTMVRDVFFNPYVKNSTHLNKVKFKKNEFNKFDLFFSKRNKLTSHIFSIDEINDDLSKKEIKKKKIANAVKNKNYINKGFRSPIKEINFDKVEYENLKAKSREKSPVRKFIFEDNYNKEGKESVIEIIQSNVKEKDKNKKNKNK